MTHSHNFKFRKFYHKKVMHKIRLMGDIQKTNTLMFVFSENSKSTIKWYEKLYIVSNWKGF